MIKSKDIIDNAYHSKIYILESLSINNIKDGVNEGNALSSVLNLARIDNSYYLINNKQSLSDSLDLIAVDINTRKSSRIPLPVLHFSFHGNEDGIGFTDETMMKWCDLRLILMNLNSKVNYTKYDERLLSRFSLSMSVCKGIHAYKIYTVNELNPFYSLVGPTEEVEWADSLVAFVTFYHNLVFKRSTIMDAIKKMNIASGLNDIYKSFLDLRFKHSNEKR
jgi:hypothetical protein